MGPLHYLISSCIPPHHISDLCLLTARPVLFLCPEAKLKQKKIEGHCFPLVWLTRPSRKRHGATTGKYYIGLSSVLVREFSRCVVLSPDAQPIPRCTAPVCQLLVGLLCIPDMACPLENSFEMRHNSRLSSKWARNTF